MTPVSIDYDAAELLSSRHKDIIVFEPSSGAAWNFNNPQWEYQGIFKTHDQVKADIGIVGLSEHYIFIWMRA